MNRTFLDAGVLILVDWVVDLEKLLRDARKIASAYGLASIDALHVAAALSCNVDDFVTTEKPTKPMYRVPNLNFVSI
jgi:predicted nucleic acid-binding protein